jgi:hypothetical protein
MYVTFLISISPLVPPPVDLLLSSAMKISFLEIGGAGPCGVDVGTYQCFGGLFQAYEALKFAWLKFIAALMFILTTLRRPGQYPCVENR